MALLCIFSSDKNKINESSKSSDSVSNSNKQCHNLRETPVKTTFLYSVIRCQSQHSRQKIYLRKLSPRDIFCVYIGAHNEF